MSSDEILDIVNRDDKVIGKDTRYEVHRKHEIHRGIHVFISNRNNDLLIQKRSKLKKDRSGYYDASVGAQVLSGESYEQAALRETEEELGIKDVVLEKVCKYESFSTRQREIRTLFLTHHEGPFKIDKREVEFVRFYCINRIKEMIAEGKNFTKGFKISLEHFLVYMKEK